MPAGDRTGPMGMGPRTGRAAGYCGGYGAPGYANPIPGRFSWMRSWWWPCWGGRGRGWRNWYYATGLPGWLRWGYPPAWFAPTISREEEAQLLRDQAEWLKSRLEAVERRLQELEKSGEDKGE